MKTILFLDLEGVLIDSWVNPTTIDNKMVNEVIDNFKVDSLFIFSAAIQNDEDLQVFNGSMRRRIEETFGIKIDEVITIEKAIKGSSWRTYNFLSIFEVMTLIGKFILFEQYCLDTHRGMKCVLLDDNCNNKYIDNIDTETKIVLVNTNNPASNVIKLIGEKCDE